MSQLYFAFGSNMSLSTLRDRGVDANPAGSALLENHRLAFTLPSERWTGRAADEAPPAREYLRRMIEGAIDAGLPAHYTDFLRNCGSVEHF